jgi:hypothetical protein
MTDEGNVKRGSVAHVHLDPDFFECDANGGKDAPLVLDDESPARFRTEFHAIWLQNTSTYINMAKKRVRTRQISP